MSSLVTFLLHAALEAPHYECHAIHLHCELKYRNCFHPSKHFSLKLCLCISGFAASVDKESSSEGEKAEDEDEEEEGDEREEAEDRKRRRAKTAKGLRQKTSKSRGEVNLTARI